MDAPDGVLDVELVLEAVGDRLGVADDQQVVGHLVGVGRAGADAVPGQEAILGVDADAVPLAFPLDPLREALSSLLPAQLQQRLQRLADGV